MTYELCKQLKDAGFPQLFCEYSYGMGIDNSYYIYINGEFKGINTIRKPEDVCYHPNLTELIEACKENLESIIQRGNGNGDNWEVRSKTERFNDTTIEEVLVKIWLSLKKLDKLENL